MEQGLSLDKPMRAVLCAVHLPEQSDLVFRESVDELKQLARTLGLDVIGEITQRRPGFDAAAYVGPGKLADLTAVVQTDAAHTLVLVDHEISPSQARHLEEETGAAGVLDRTAVILEIFHRHAHSRQAKLQVEMVRLAYLAPRLRETEHAGDRQRGFIGGKGAGESALELDRRKIRDRLALLRKELKQLEAERAIQRQRRQGLRRVAICGYTNAGKSTLFRALTQAEVYIADELFATLDVTVRTLHPPAHPKVLISDTIGFIRNLPTSLVSSFKSTLDEATEAGLILHVVDVSDPAWERQMATTQEVLAEIGAGEIPQQMVFNKIDCCSEPDSLRASLLKKHPDALVVSAYMPEDVLRVHQAIVSFFDAQLVEATVLIPYSHQHLRGPMFEQGQVLEEKPLETGTSFRIRAEGSWLSWLRKQIEAPSVHPVQNHTLLKEDVP